MSATQSRSRAPSATRGIHLRPDTEGAGALFRFSTLDFANLPRTPEGKDDLQRIFLAMRRF
jgi:hypothetical protein